MSQDWNPTVEIKGTAEPGFAPLPQGWGTGRMRYFDEHGEVTQEIFLLREILATLKRIDSKLTKSE